MPLSSALIDITGHQLIPLEKAADGLYVYPRVRYGMLPYYINEIGQIVWGCIESNRVEPITLAPAAGTQDIIAIKDEQRLVLESGKPFPDVGEAFHFLHPFKGQAFREEAYQNIIECFIINGFNVYLENPLATAIHEAYEEHGIDLRNTMGHDNHLLKKPIALSKFQLIPAQVGVGALGVWLPELTGSDGVLLRNTTKIDRKMRRNYGREFYEKGSWATLDELKTGYMQQTEKFSSLEGYLPVKVELIAETLRAYERDIQFLERMERLVLAERESLENPDITTPAAHPNAFFNQTRVDYSQASSSIGLNRQQM